MLHTEAPKHSVQGPAWSKRTRTHPAQLSYRVPGTVLVLRLMVSQWTR